MIFNVSSGNSTKAAQAMTGVTCEVDTVVPD